LGFCFLLPLFSLKTVMITDFQAPAAVETIVAAVVADNDSRQWLNCKIRGGGMLHSGLGL